MPPALKAAALASMAYSGTGRRRRARPRRPAEGWRGRGAARGQGRAPRRGRAPPAAAARLRRGKEGGGAHTI